MINSDRIRQNKFTIGLALLTVLIIAGGLFSLQKFLISKSQAPVEEVDLTFDPEGPYALLIPRRDGNALFLQLKRTSSYDSISYELAYNAEGIDRGVVGEINTKGRKGEYEQEILFGTCSKNVCKYDKGVENGTLTLHIKRGNQAFRMITQWHLQQPAVALGILRSGDEHFSYTTLARREELTLVGYSIINDLTGVPKLPAGKEVFGKVYALNVPIGKNLMEGTVSVELVEKPPAGAKISRYAESQNRWIEYETKVDGSKLSTKADGAGIFAVLVDKTN